MNIDKIVNCPSQYYVNPEEILKEGGLSLQQKFKALTNWKQTCIQIQESTTEGMEGKGKSKLQAVSNALNIIESKAKVTGS
jgi:methionine synthase II (cobalamin-independent)